MRCPKCGYISFDHIQSCTNCGKDLVETAAELQGTARKTQFSYFLGSVIGGELTQEDIALPLQGDTGEGMTAEEEFAAVEEPADIEMNLGDAEADTGLSLEESAIDLSQVDEYSDSLEPLSISDIPVEEDEDLADLALDDEENVIEMADGDTASLQLEKDYTGGESENISEITALSLQDDDELQLGDDEDLSELQLQDDEELAGLELADDEAQSAPRPEDNIKLNIEVEMEDEEPVDIALDEIDLSDLVIDEEPKSQEAAEEDAGSTAENLEASDSFDQAPEDDENIIMDTEAASADSESTDDLEMLSLEDDDSEDTINSDIELNLETDDSGPLEPKL